MRNRCHHSGSRRVLGCRRYHSLIVSADAFQKIELIEADPEPSNIAYQTSDLTVTIDPPLEYVHAEVDPNTGERLKSGESEWGDR